MVVRATDPDAFSDYYAELLEDTYDGVDRIVWGAYFAMGQSPGGFRAWWRRLHDGSDAQLDNTHLLRLAGRFSCKTAWLGQET